MDKIRAILIDPRNKSITEVNYTGEYRNIYTHIGADCFDCVRLGDENENTIFVDDNGLLTGKQHTEGMFRVAGQNPAYLAGRGLILGTDAEGESIATDLTVADVEAMVDFGHVRKVLGNLIFVGDKEDYYIE